MIGCPGSIAGYRVYLNLQELQHRGLEISEAAFRLWSGECDRWYSLLPVVMQMQIEDVVSVTHSHAPTKSHLGALLPRWPEGIVSSRNGTLTFVLTADLLW